MSVKILLNITKWNEILISTPYHNYIYFHFGIFVVKFNIHVHYVI